MKKIFVYTFLLSSLFAQTKNPYAILDELKNNFDKIEDYSAEISIHLDVSFLQMPDSKAKVYYKKPDKFKMDSDGFAMLPKQGVGFSPRKLLEYDYDAVYIKEDTLDNRKVDVIKVIPRSDSSEIILTTAWIDLDRKLIRKIETNSRNTGSFKMEFTYSETYEYGLPIQIKFYFNISDVKMPKNIGDKGKKPQKNDIEGAVILTYSKYAVNKGLSDEFFDDKNDKKKKLR